MADSLSEAKDNFSKEFFEDKHPYVEGVGVVPMKDHILVCLNVPYSCILELPLGDIRELPTEEYHGVKVRYEFVHKINAFTESPGEEAIRS